MQVWGDGTWWQQVPDGSWVRWDIASGAWLPASDPPPDSSVEVPRPPDGPTGGFQQLSTLARWVVILLGIAAVLGAVSAIADIAQIRLVARLTDPNRPPLDSLEEAQANDTRQMLIEGVQAAGYLTTAIVFIAWLHRAYSNLWWLGLGRVRFRPGWAIGAWFVPVLVWIRPKQMIDDVWRGSDPEADLTTELDWTKKDVPDLFDLWWAAFILMRFFEWNVFFPVGFYVTFGSAGLNAIRVLIGDVFYMAAALAAIKVVQRTTARQEARFRNMSAIAERSTHPAREVPTGEAPEENGDGVRDVEEHALGILWGRDRDGRTVYKKPGEDEWRLYDPESESLVAPAAYRTESESK